MFQFSRVNVVILDRVPISDDLGMLHPLDRTHHLKLYVNGKGSTHTVDVILRLIHRLRLDKNLMTRSVTETVNLVFDAWTVAWSHAVNLPGKERCTIKIALNDLMGMFIGIGHIAGKLLWIECFSVRPEGKGRRRGISRLYFHDRDVDRFGIDTRTGTCFKPSHFQTDCFEIFCKFHRSKFSLTPCCLLFFPNMNQPIQKGSGSNDNLFRAVCIPKLGRYPFDLTIFNNQTVSDLLFDIEIVCIKHHCAHILTVVIHIDLRTCTANCRSLGSIKSTKLYTCRIGTESHLTPKCIDLAHQMPFCKSSDSRITRTGTDLFNKYGN